MNKNIIILTIVLVAVIGGGIFYLTKGKAAPVQPQTPAQTNTSTTTETQTSQTNLITIKNFSFSPSALTVKAGTKVMWKNEDSAPHKIKSETFNSEDLNTGDTFEFTFDTPGTFDYICSIHPSMKGTIIVE